MITGNIKSAEKYFHVSKDFETIFKHFLTLDETSTGRVDFADGVWVNCGPAPETVESGKPFEAHRNYLDIHYIVSGKEAFGYSNVDYLTTTQEYNEKDDFELLEGEINTLYLNEGDFCIVFPEDAHIPCMQKLSDNLVRAVGKVRWVE